jgi:hypothetical protein
MSPKLLRILQHSLGADEFGRGNQFRNHFCTGPGSKDYDACKELVGMGLMNERRGNELSGGDSIFRVTGDGKEAMTRESPKPPRLTASQARYQRYLSIGDLFPDFKAFLKYDSQRTPTP